MAPAGVVCTPAFASQSPDALKGQPELQDPPAGSEGPRGLGRRLRQPRGSRTRGRPRGPPAPSRGPRPPSRAPFTSGPPLCPHLGRVPCRPLAAATAAARPPRIHSNPQPGAGSGKPRARAARACPRPEGGPGGVARKGAWPAGLRVPGTAGCFWLTLREGSGEILPALWGTRGLSREGLCGGGEGDPRGRVRGDGGRLEGIRGAWSGGSAGAWAWLRGLSPGREV